MIDTRKTLRGLVMRFALGMTFLVAGCAQTTPTRTAGTDPACIAWAAVTYSSYDTEETQRQARGNNAARQAYCGK